MSIRLTSPDCRPACLDRDGHQLPSGWRITQAIGRDSIQTRRIHKNWHPNVSSHSTPPTKRASADLQICLSALHISKAKYPGSCRWITRNKPIPLSKGVEGGVGVDYDYPMITTVRDEDKWELGKEESEEPLMTRGRKVEAAKGPLYTPQVVKQVKREVDRLCTAGLGMLPGAFNACLFVQTVQPWRRAHHVMGGWPELGRECRQAQALLTRATEGATCHRRSLRPWRLCCVDQRWGPLHLQLPYDTPNRSALSKEGVGYSSVPLVRIWRDEDVAFAPKEEWWNRAQTDRDTKPKEKNWDCIEYFHAKTSTQGLGIQLMTVVRLE
ncbi:hypothetical protein DFP72DRAFT_857654 [Ephemerocybe angulata]|uniref:Uncharacterized protein n=1 Tax=Ephemerocybe angulata TaxID=980116 RepID=A0A8H6HC72_9AGAR|nr:hypothetical protein DFP72DRAFT_857654 [Tulosesus angulatus]